MTGEISWEGRAAWWPDPYDGAVPGGDSNVWMCAEDLGLELWTHFHRLERHRQYDPEPVWLEGCPPELRDILVECLPYNEHRGDLSGAVAHFARMVAQQLFLDGAMTFEAKGGWDRSGMQPRLEQATLMLIPRTSLVRLPKRVFQVVPAGSEDETSRERVILLEPARLFEFRLPTKWQRPLERLRSGLRIIGRSEHGWMMAVGRHKVPEDFKAVTRKYAVQRARLTAPIGWNARGLFREYISDYHWVARELQWKRFCVEIRDEVLTTLARVFALVGSWRGECPRLRWGHLPTVEQVVEAEHKLAGAGSRFDDALKPFSLRLD